MGEFETPPVCQSTASKFAELQTILDAATPGPWHHVNPGMVSPKTRTIHGTVPAEPVDYVSTWPGLGTPPGHRVVIPRDAGVRSADMALIAEAPALAAEVLELRAQAAASAERIKELELFVAQIEHRFVPKNVRLHYLRALCSNESVQARALLKERE